MFLVLHVDFALLILFCILGLHYLKISPALQINACFTNELVLCNQPLAFISTWGGGEDSRQKELHVIHYLDWMVLIAEVMKEGKYIRCFDRNRSGVDIGMNEDTV